jgi:hypothetical protein
VAGRGFARGMKSLIGRDLQGASVTDAKDRGKS